MEGPTPKDMLLVEDSPADIYRVQWALADCSPALRLSVVARSSEALPLLRHEPPFVGVSSPKLVLLDLSLPGRDGRAIPPEYQTMPGVGLSGAERAVEERGCLEFGATAYVQKMDPAKT